MPLRHSKRGQDHSWSGHGIGYEIKLSAGQNGWRFKVSAEAKFEAMTDKQAMGFRTMLHNAIDEALRTAASQRHVNIPLFDLPDEAQTTNTQGVNEL
jgi:hypothetical protein